MDRKNHNLKPIVLLLLCALSLTACGKKPGHVDPPPDVKKDEFPYTYPDPDSDPKP